MTTPTIGRIVHYTNLGDADGRYPPEAHPAIITKIDKQEIDNDGVPPVSLLIFYETGLFQMQHVPFSDEPMVRGHWNWPPLV